MNMIVAPTESISRLRTQIILTQAKVSLKTLSRCMYEISSHHWGIIKLSVI